MTCPEGSGCGSVATLRVRPSAFSTGTRRPVMALFCKFMAHRAVQSLLPPEPQPGRLPYSRVFSMIHDNKKRQCQFSLSCRRGYPTSGNGLNSPIFRKNECHRGVRLHPSDRGKPWRKAPPVVVDCVKIHQSISRIEAISSFWRSPSGRGSLSQREPRWRVQGSRRERGERRKTPLRKG